MKEIVLVPGLGADHRVFDFLDLSGYSTYCISWIDPLKNESIEAYSARLAKQIKFTNPIIIGVSFGGMIAIELGKQLKNEEIILISSVRIKSEIPWYLLVIGALRIHRLAPKFLLKKPGALLYYAFGVTDKAGKKLLSDIVRNTDSNFQVWAIDKIVRWKNMIVPQHTTLIHGTNDRIFPANKGDLTINKGGHFMIVNKAKEVSEHLRSIIG